MKIRGVLAGLGVLVLAGCGGQPASPATVTVTAPTTVATTVTAAPKTVTAAPVTTTVPVTVTASAAAATNDPSGPKANGNYLVPLQITPGNWQCGSGDDSTFWRISDSSANTIDNGFSTIASVASTAFSADLKRCNSTWTLVG